MSENDAHCLKDLDLPVRSYLMLACVIEKVRTIRKLISLYDVVGYPACETHGNNIKQDLKKGQIIFEFAECRVLRL